MDPEFLFVADKQYSQGINGSAFGVGYVSTTGRQVSDGANGTPRVGTETRSPGETVTWCTVGADKAVTSQALKPR